MNVVYMKEKLRKLLNDMSVNVSNEVVFNKHAEKFERTLAMTNDEEVVADYMSQFNTLRAVVRHNANVRRWINQQVESN